MGYPGKPPTSYMKLWITRSPDNLGEAWPLARLRKIVGSDQF
jgi:hypothetical protein